MVAGVSIAPTSVRSDINKKNMLRNGETGQQMETGYFNKKYFKALETFFDRNPWGKNVHYAAGTQDILFTNVVPIEVDHKDGNVDNNSEENLRLLCPNCHALTPNFRNLNKGRGRSWRKII